MKENTVSESKRLREAGVVKDKHLADPSRCVLAVRAVEQGRIRSVKALIGNRPVGLL